MPAGSYQEAISRTVVTTGSAQLIYLVCEALLDPGDIVLVESPTYFVFLGPVETRGARAIRVPIDQEGLRIDALERTLARIQSEGQLDRVKFIYTIPEHANPTGISLAAQRRRPLLELTRRWSIAANRRIFLLEDAAYHGLSYGTQEPQSLWSLDPDGETVILARTFSKTFSPGVKIGYGVLPKGLIEPILRLKGNHDFGSANFNQQVLEQALASGDYDRHVARLRELYGRKRDVFLEAIERFMGPLSADVQWTHPHGGLFVWMTLPDHIDTGFDGSFFQRCLEQGVLYVPGEYAFAPEPGPVPRNHLRLTFGVPVRGRAGGRSPAAGRRLERLFGHDRLKQRLDRRGGSTGNMAIPPFQAVLQGQGSRTGEAVVVSILQRYVSGEVLRAFLLSLLTMTVIFVLFMVAAEAMRSKLLGPQDVAQLVPFVIPSTLPYTIPVSLLFAVTVVYGRIAGDNEIIAVKSAGLSVMTVIWPTILAGRRHERPVALSEPGLDSHAALTTPSSCSSRTWRTHSTSSSSVTASSTTRAGRS